MSPFLTQVIGGLSGRRTEIDYYKIRIQLQKFATPADIVELAELEEPWLPEFKAWLADFRAQVLACSPVVQDYRLNPLGGSVFLYSGPKPAPVLIFGLCGQADLLFMPIAVFLQYLVAGRHDLMLLRDPERVGFLGGMRGYATTFREMAEKLAVEPIVARYPEKRAVGTSGGGLPALILGGAFEATSAVCFSGHLPSDSLLYSKDARVADFEAMVSEVGARGERRTGVFSADHAFDRENAARIAERLKVDLISVPGSNHNVAFELHRRRELAPMLASVGLTT
jgi:hypothetical protein